MIDCLIIGGGPAGMTAAIYLRRFRREVCIVDGGQSRAQRIARTRNYPGFPAGISGEHLLSQLRAQLAQYGEPVVDATVTTLTKRDAGHFSAEVAGRVVEARTVLLATGLVDVEPDMQGYKEVRSADLIRFCPICDGFEYTGQRIGIIGAGEHGLRECEFMQTYSEQLVYVAMDAMTPNIASTLQAMNVTRIDGSRSRLRRIDAAQDAIEIEAADGSRHTVDVLYCALGIKVFSTLALDIGARHDAQCCLVVNDHFETSIDGLFAAGDVVSSLHQLSVATGQAAVASTAIHNKLRNAAA